MRFAFTEDQRLFRAAVAELLAAECPPGVVRAAWDGDRGPTHGVWARLTEQAVPALAVPEALGGMGLGAVALVGILEETGRVALPGPFAETAFVAPLALAEVPEGEPLLRAIASGERVAVGRLEHPVAHAGGAHHLLLLQGDDALLAPRAAVEVTPLQSVDRTRGTARVTVDPARAVRLPRGVATRVQDLAALGAAAQLLGLGHWMLDCAVAYATVREQFRRPIGSFQAVQHHLADARVALHVAEPLVHRAAWSIDARSPLAGLHASLAKAEASEAAALVARKALQVHGAIGYSTEHDLHLWMKRTWALTRAWGDSTHHRDAVAAALLDAPDGASEPNVIALREGIDA